MPKITVLPHEELCPTGKEFEADKGVSLADALLDHGVDIEHACGNELVPVVTCRACGGEVRHEDLIAHPQAPGWTTQGPTAA